MRCVHLLCGLLLITLGYVDYDWPIFSFFFFLFICAGLWLLIMLIMLRVFDSSLIFLVSVCEFHEYYVTTYPFPEERGRVCTCSTYGDPFTIQGYNWSQHIRVQLYFSLFLTVILLYGCTKTNNIHCMFCFGNYWTTEILDNTEQM